MGHGYGNTWNEISVIVFKNGARDCLASLYEYKTRVDLKSNQIFINFMAPRRSNFARRFRLIKSRFQSTNAASYTVHVRRALLATCFRQAIMAVDALE